MIPESPSRRCSLSSQKPRDARSPLHRLRGPAWADQEPTWQDAKPGLIRAALRRAAARPSGNWFVFAASREIRADRAFGRRVGGADLVGWRDAEGALHVGPGACPHLGAALCNAPVRRGELICRWHGLALTSAGRPGWRPYPAFDDGVLAWVRLDGLGGEAPLPEPVVPARAGQAAGHSAGGGAGLDAVATVIGHCEPEDVVANRLDPWHGAWFHPYSFANLTVISAPTIDSSEADDRFLVEVSFRVGPRHVVPVHAAFSSPEPRTVLMEIVDGEGVGSVVETHSTPLGPGPDGVPRTAVIEAVVAHSDRAGFARAAIVAPAIRPLIKLAARRLWRDDIAYAERRYVLRTR